MSDENKTSYKYKEALVEIGWGDFDEMYPLLTREETEKKINYYLFDKIKIFQKRIEKRQLIKSFKLIGVPLLNIYYDGLHDNYLLFNSIPIWKRENDRDFWNDWE